MGYFGGACFSGALVFCFTLQVLFVEPQLKMSEISWCWCFATPRVIVQKGPLFQCEIRDVVTSKTLLLCLWCGLLFRRLNWLFDYRAQKNRKCKTLFAALMTKRNMKPAWESRRWTVRGGRGFTKWEAKKERNLTGVSVQFGTSSSSVCACVHVD